MSHTDFSVGVWPPHGWTEFQDIELLANQTIHKDPISSTVTGLCYKIEPIPVFKKKSRTYIYNISIDSWEYSISNESREIPVLSFLLGEKKLVPTARDFAIENIKVFSRSIDVNAKSSHRLLTAALYLIRQINNDRLPDVRETLKLHKLYPTPTRTYRSANKNQLVNQSYESFKTDEEKLG